MDDASATTTSFGTTSFGTTSFGTTSFGTTWTDDATATTSFGTTSFGTTWVEDMTTWTPSPQAELSQDDAALDETRNAAFQVCVLTRVQAPGINPLDVFSRDE